MSEALLSPVEQEVGPVVESVERSLAENGAVRMVRTRLSQSSRRAGRRRVARGCRECGVVLEDQERVVCDECLPEVDAARTNKLKAAGTQARARLRASADDPSKRPEAIARRGEALRRQWALQKAWEAENPGPHDRDRYGREIWTGLAELPVAEIARVTRLSKVAARDIRSGKQTPHPRHWKVLALLATTRES